MLALAAVGVAAVAGAGSAAAIGFGGGGNGTPSRGALPPATAKITRTALHDTQKEDGTLGYGKESTVSGRAAGTVTWLPDTGAVVRRGEALYKVDDVPVFALYGSLPAYRDLAPGAEGADVKQFEQELRALGYTGFTVDEEYTESTASAVRRWQEKAGLAETGVVESRRVVYTPGEVRVATTKLAVGEGAQGAVLTYTGTSRLVTVKLDVRDQRLANKDAAVSVELPDGRTVQGTVAGIRTVVETGSAPDAEAETVIEVTVGLADAAAISGFDDATVEVTFTVSERKDVLTVPVAALLALAEGGYGVQVVDGGTTRIVRVETGLFAGGRVEITGAGLDAGMAVGVPA